MTPERTQELATVAILCVLAGLMAFYEEEFMAWVTM